MQRKKKAMNNFTSSTWKQHTILKKKYSFFLSPIKFTEYLHDNNFSVSARTIIAYNLCHN